MKKIISGYFYRLIKGFEIWLLAGLFIASSLFFIIDLLNGPVITCSSDITVHPLYSDDVIIKKEDIKRHRFENLDISARDVYRCFWEPIPDEAYKIISDPATLADNESIILTEFIEHFNIVPTALTLLLIPILLGRIFSDKTIKNLISCGYKKSTIYFSSLLFCFVIEFSMIFTEVIEFVIFCSIYRWHPPVYLPLILVLIASELCLMITLTSVCLAVLFISTRKTLAFIACFLAAIGLFINLSNPARLILEYSYSSQHANYRENQELYHKARKEKGQNAFYHQIDLGSFHEKIFLDGRDLSFDESTLSPVAKATLVAVIYSDPSLFSHPHFSYNAYLYYRDGVMAINIAANIFWTILSNGAALLVLRKKELHG